MDKLLQIQKISCFLLDEFIQICEKNNLQWFVDSGTLLGAVRNGGFIPWDDDIDIVMPRKDYNKLLSLGKLLFKPPLFLQTPKTDNIEKVATRLICLDTTFICKDIHLSYIFRPQQKFQTNPCIGINIVPIDYIPENNKQRDMLLNLVYFIIDNSKISNFDCDNSNIYRLLQLENVRKGFDLYNQIMTEIDERNNQSKIMACTSWWPLNTLRRLYVSSSCYDNYIEKTFEGCLNKVRVPIGYEEILTSYYGNYKIEQDTKQNRLLSIALIDTKHSFHEYEKFSNTELHQMINGDNQ